MRQLFLQPSIRQARLFVHFAFSPESREPGAGSSWEVRCHLCERKTDDSNRSVLTVELEIRHCHRSRAVLVKVAEVCHGGAALEDSEPVERHRVSAPVQTEPIRQTLRNPLTFDADRCKGSMIALSYGGTHLCLRKSCVHRKTKRCGCRIILIRVEHHTLSIILSRRIAQRDRYER